MILFLRILTIAIVTALIAALIFLILAGCAVVSYTTEGI